MKQLIQIVNIDGEWVFLRFPDNTIRKYLKDNFLKEPIVGKFVMFLDNGLIIEKNINDGELNDKKVASRSYTICMRIFSTSLMIVYLCFIFLFVWNNQNISGLAILLSLIFGIYIFIILFCFFISSIFINNRFLKKLLLILLIGLLILVFLFILVYFLLLFMALVSCIACLGGA